MKSIKTVLLLILGGHSLCLTLSAPSFGNIPDVSNGAIKIEALCTISNAYAVCNPRFSGDELIINFPSELIVLKKSDIAEIRLYDSRTRQFIRFFNKVGDYDFAITFNDSGRTRTGFVRFKNNKSTESFARLISDFYGQKLFPE